jgi:hypothetical protein
MQPTGGSRRESFWAAGVLLWGMAALAVALPWTAASTAADPGVRITDGQIYSIELPYEEPPKVPAGPNVAQFTAYCRLCHSPRIVLTQPRLTEKKWTEVVKKMVVTYGAQIPPEQEPLIVQYLTTILGPKQAGR